MTGDNYPLRDTIKATVAAVFGRVTEEDTWHGARGKLVWCGSYGFWVTQTAKNVEVSIRRIKSMQDAIGDAVRKSCGRESIEEKDGCVKGLCPILWWHAGLKKECVDRLIECANNAPSLAVLLGGVWA
jgi:hypothetical protein